MLREVAVESAIYFVWACLLMVDGVLRGLMVVRGLFDACAGLLLTEHKRQHVVIVGASFGGLAAQRAFRPA